MNELVLVGPVHVPSQGVIVVVPNCAAVPYVIYPFSNFSFVVRNYWYPKKPNGADCFCLFFTINIRTIGSQAQITVHHLHQ